MLINIGCRNSFDVEQARRLSYDRSADTAKGGELIGTEENAMVIPELLSILFQPHTETEADNNKNKQHSKTVHCTVHEQLARSSALDLQEPSEMPPLFLSIH